MKTRVKENVDDIVELYFLGKDLKEILDTIGREEERKKSKIRNKTCKSCKKTLPLTSQYFHRSARAKDGFVDHCKDCRNEYQRDYMQNRWEGNPYPSRADKGYSRNSEVATILNNAKIFKGRLDGLSYKQGITYKVEYRTGERTKEEFIGKLIFEKKEYIALKNKYGIVECFLKVDFLTTDTTIEEL